MEVDKIGCNDYTKIIQADANSSLRNASDGDGCLPPSGRRSIFCTCARTEAPGGNPTYHFPTFLRIVESRPY